MTVPHAALDQLYEAPLDQFTTTRKELVRKLRADGDRAAADELGRLRKPSVASWGLNQLRRRHRGRVDELLAAGDRLREAQQRLLSGGDRGTLREAAIDERRLVSELVELGARELGEAGHPATAAVQNRLQETLHSAAGNAEARELLEAGRLVRDYQISDLGLPMGAARPQAPKLARRTGQPQSARKAQAAKRRLEKARARHHELLDRAKAAEQAAREAQRKLSRASAAAERAETGASRARAAAQEAATRADEIEEELRSLAP